MTSTEIKPIADATARSKALMLLKAGGLVAIPTETVYGLAADATQRNAVRSIYAAKGRPQNNPLICHVDGPDMAARYVEVSDLARSLMSAFWPGPLTLVLPLRTDAEIAAEVTAGLHTLAVRCPNQPHVSQLISALNHPIAAPSANPSGKLSPTRAEDVQAGLNGKIDLILDGGETTVGLESTIIGVTDIITLLRAGTITANEISSATGLDVHEPGESKTLTAPGQLASHYAPDQNVSLNVLAPRSGATHIGFGSNGGDFNLSSKGDLVEAAQKLFRTLRDADARGLPITVAPIPDTGVGRALNDRLRRAAADRPE